MFSKCNATKPGILPLYLCFCPKRNLAFVSAEVHFVSSLKCTFDLKMCNNFKKVWGQLIYGVLVFTQKTEQMIYWLLLSKKRWGFRHISRTLCKPREAYKIIVTLISSTPSRSQVELNIPQKTSVKMSSFMMLKLIHPISSPKLFFGPF